MSVESNTRKQRGAVSATEDSTHSKIYLDSIDSLSVCDSCLDSGSTDSKCEPALLARLSPLSIECVVVGACNWIFMASVIDGAIINFFSFFDSEIFFKCNSPSVLFSRKSSFFQVYHNFTGNQYQNEENQSSRVLPCSSKKNIIRIINSLFLRKHCNESLSKGSFKKHTTVINQALIRSQSIIMPELLDEETIEILSKMDSFFIQQRVRLIEAVTQGCWEQPNVYDVFDHETNKRIMVSQGIGVLWNAHSKTIIGVVCWYPPSIFDIS